MGKDDRPRVEPRLVLLCLCLGALIGGSWAMRLDEEQRRRIRKTLFELGELPFRVFI
jgi:hypothetical protein